MAAADVIEIPESAQPRVSIIIPSAAGHDLLLAALRSLALHAPRALPFETIVVLNEADAQSVRALEPVRGIRLVPSAVNLGLAGAGNRGRNAARGELLILLHDDAEVQAGWMEALVAAADARPEAGAVGGKVLNMDGSLQSAGLVLWRDGFTTAPWQGASAIDGVPAAVDRRRAVDYCGSSSLLVRSGTWDAVGGLDEELYPVYYVDVDLAMAIRAAGQVVLYEPAAVSRHHRGGSGSRRWRSFVSGRNRQRFVAKWARELEEHHQRRGATGEALAHALEGAEAFHQRVCASPRTLPRRQWRPLAIAEHELAHLQRDRALQKEYIRFLSEELEGFELPWFHLFERFRARIRFFKRLAGR